MPGLDIAIRNVAGLLVRLPPGMSIKMRMKIKIVGQHKRPRDFYIGQPPDPPTPCPGKSRLQVRVPSPFFSVLLFFIVCIGTSLPWARNAG